MSGYPPDAGMSRAEREVWARAISYRMPDGTIIRWTGERWREDLYIIADDYAVDLPAPTTVTLARTLLPDGRACKRWRAGEDEADGYDLGTWVRLETREIELSARGLCDLFKRLESDRGACLVHGIRARGDVEIPEFAPEGWPYRERQTSMHGVRRASSVATDDGLVAGFLAPPPEGQRWIVIDIDKAPPPSWTPSDRPPTPDEAARIVREIADLYLPRTWQGCALAYQWSQSAGVRLWHEQVSLHLGVCLDRPVYLPALRAWAATWGKPADASTLGAVQPIYTSAPLFEGTEDPLEAAGIPRSGYLPGELAAVPIPPAIWTVESGLVPLVDGAAWYAHEAAEEEERRARDAVRELRGALVQLRASDDSNATWIARYCAGALRGACDRIRNAAQGVAGNGRHDTLCAEAIGDIGAMVRGGHLRHDEAEDALISAFLAVAGAGRRKEAARAVKSGFAKAKPVSREALLARRQNRRAA